MGKKKTEAAKTQSITTQSFLDFWREYYIKEELQSQKPLIPDHVIHPTQSHLNPIYELINTTSAHDAQDKLMAYIHKKAPHFFQQTFELDENLLHLSVKKRDLVTVKALCELEPILVHHRNHAGNTPFTIAIEDYFLHLTEYASFTTDRAFSWISKNLYSTKRASIQENMNRAKQIILCIVDAAPNLVAQSIPSKGTLIHQCLTFWDNDLPFELIQRYPQVILNEYSWHGCLDTPFNHILHYYIGEKFLNDNSFSIKPLLLKLVPFLVQEADKSDQPRLHPFYNAIISGSVEAVSTLMNLFPEFTPYTRIGDQETPFMVAALYGIKHVAQYIASLVPENNKEAYFSSLDKYGRPLGHLLALQGSPILEDFIEEGFIRPSQYDEHNNSLLCYTLPHNSVELTLNFSKKYKLSLMHKNAAGKNILHLAQEHYYDNCPENKHFFYELVKQVALSEKKPLSALLDVRLIHTAIENNDIDGLTWFVKQAPQLIHQKAHLQNINNIASLSGLFPSGVNSLDVAIFTGSLDSVNFLVEKNVARSAAQLFLAVESGQPAILELITKNYFLDIQSVKYPSLNKKELSELLSCALYNFALCNSKKNPSTLDKNKSLEQLGQCILILLAKIKTVLDASCLSKILLTLNQNKSFIEGKKKIEIIIAWLIKNEAIKQTDLSLEEFLQFPAILIQLIKIKIYSADAVLKEFLAVYTKPSAPKSLINEFLKDVINIRYDYFKIPYNQPIESTTETLATLAAQHKNIDLLKWMHTTGFDLAGLLGMKNLVQIAIINKDLSLLAWSSQLFPDSLLTVDKESHLTPLGLACYDHPSLESVMDIICSTIGSKKTYDILTKALTLDRALMDYVYRKLKDSNFDSIHHDGYLWGYLVAQSTNLDSQTRDISNLILNKEKQLFFKAIHYENEELTCQLFNSAFDKLNDPAILEQALTIDTSQNIKKWLLSLTNIEAPLIIDQEMIISLLSTFDKDLIRRVKQEELLVMKEQDLNYHPALVEAIRSCCQAEHSLKSAVDRNDARLIYHLIRIRSFTHAFKTQLHQLLIESIQKNHQKIAIDLLRCKNIPQDYWDETTIYEAYLICDQSNRNDIKDALKKFEYLKDILDEHQQEYHSETIAVQGENSSEAPVMSDLSNESYWNTQEEISSYQSTEQLIWQAPTINYAYHLPINYIIPCFAYIDLIAAAQTGNVQFIDLFLKNYQYHLSSVSGLIHDLYFQSVEFQQITILNLLLAQCPPQEHEQNFYHWLLSKACSQGNLYLVEQLLSSSVIYGISSLYDNHALKCSITTGQILVAKRLLEVPRCYMTVTHNNNAVLRHAISYGRTQIVAILLQNRSVREAVASSEDLIAVQEACSILNYRFKRFTRANNLHKSIASKQLTTAVKIKNLLLNIPNILERALSSDAMFHYKLHIIKHLKKIAESRNPLCFSKIIDPMLSFCEKENCPESADIIQKLLNHPRLQSYFAKKGYSSSNQTETEADGTLVPSKNLIMSQASFHFESTTQERHSL